MDDTFSVATAASLAAPFQDPPQATDLLPAPRWSERDEYSADGERLLDVIHYVETDGRFTCCVSLIEATRDGRNWQLYAVEGDELDEASEILLSGDLTRERWNRPTLYRVDPLDHALERCRMRLEAKLEAA